MRLFIHNKADLHHWTSHDLSILHLAAEGGSIECCDLLIKHGISMDIRNTEGVTPFISAVRNFRLPTILYFLNLGCSLEKLPGEKFTALNEAVSRDLDRFIIKKMLACGANPNSVDHANALPLWYAVDNANFPVIKLLLQSNSDFSKQNESYASPCSPCSPIIHSVHKENPTLVQWLVAAYAEEGATILRNMNIFYAMLQMEDFSMAEIMSETLFKPQSLLRLCRRQIRKTLGSGLSVSSKISHLQLPPLLTSYMMFSDLDPREMTG